MNSGKYNFNYYEVMLTLFNHICIFVFLYKSINLKMAGMPAETCW